MPQISWGHGLRPFSASRRRTVSPDKLSWSVSLTIAPAKSSSVQRARPSGGVAQAVATSKASSLPVSLRSAPGRGSSRSARSRLPSTKRRLVRYTVDPPAETDIQRHFQVSPPSVHQMIVTLERNGLIRRQPGVARSIQILVTPEDLPILNWLGINQS